MAVDGYHDALHEYLVGIFCLDCLQLVVLQLLAVIGVVELLAEENEVADALLQDLDIEGFGDIGVGADAKTLQHGFFVGTGGEEDDGDVGKLDILFQLATEGDTVHLRHGDIADDGIGGMAEHEGEGFFAVAGFTDVVAG